MTGFQDLSEPRKCGAKNRQSGFPCNDWTVPFGLRCRRHGGNTKAAREKTRKALQDYLLWSNDPAWRKYERERRWKASMRRWEMRRAKKRGPQYVAALKAEWAAEEAEKKAWADDNRRAKAEQKQREKEEWLRSQGKAPAAPEPSPYYDPPPGGYSTGFEWDL